MTNVSLSWPHEEPASAFMTLSLAWALVTEFMMWWEKVYMLSKVTPSNFGVWSSLADFPFSLDLDFGMDLELAGVGGE